MKAFRIYNTKSKAYLTSIGIGLKKTIFTEENWEIVMWTQSRKSKEARKNLVLKVYELTESVIDDITLDKLNSEDGLKLIEKALSIKEILEG